MPYTDKQRRFFQGVAHGMKPRQDSSLTPAKAKTLLSHEDDKIKAKIAGQRRALKAL